MIVHVVSKFYILEGGDSMHKIIIWSGSHQCVYGVGAGIHGKGWAQWYACACVFLLVVCLSVLHTRHEHTSVCGNVISQTSILPTLCVYIVYRSAWFWWSIVAHSHNLYTYWLPLIMAENYCFINRLCVCLCKRFRHGSLPNGCNKQLSTPVRQFGIYMYIHCVNHAPLSQSGTYACNYSNCQFCFHCCGLV